jgi:hypothetical protein
MASSASHESARDRGSIAPRRVRRCTDSASLDSYSGGARLKYWGQHRLSWQRLSCFSSVHRRFKRRHDTSISFFQIISHLLHYLPVLYMAVPGGKFSILGGHSTGHSKHKHLRVYVCPIPNGFRDRGISPYTVQSQSALKHCNTHHRDNLNSDSK